MRKKYLKGIVAGMMVGAVVLTNGQIVSAKTEKDWQWDFAHNYGVIYEGYNARDYALKYCGEVGTCKTGGYNNAKYHNFVGRGGDCTNFVSQCIKRGGMVEVDDGRGYNNSDDDDKPSPGLEYYWCAGKQGRKWKATDTWTNCDKFEEYMRKSRSVTSYRRTSEEFVRKNAAVGDVVLFVDGNDAVHAMIVTMVTKKEIYLAGHSNNRDKHPLAEACDSYKNKCDYRLTLTLLKFTSVK